MENATAQTLTSKFIWGTSIDFALAGIAYEDLACADTGGIRFAAAAGNKSGR